MYRCPFGVQSFLMRTQKLVGLLIILGLFSAQAKAEDIQTYHSHGKLWKFSAVMLTAVTIADMQSSVGRQEANPLLASQSGQFSGQGVAIKGLVVGGVLGVQWIMLRRNPQASKYAAGANFAMAAITGAVVVHNHMIK
jgi:hypothetical protein